MRARSPGLGPIVALMWLLAACTHVVTDPSVDGSGDSSGADVAGDPSGEGAVGEVAGEGVGKPDVDAADPGGEVRPDAPEVPDAEDVFDAADAPDAADLLDTAEATDAPDLPEAEDVQGETGMPDGAELPEGVEAAEPAPEVAVEVVEALETAQEINDAVTDEGGGPSTLTLGAVAPVAFAGTSYGEGGLTLVPLPIWLPAAPAASEGGGVFVHPVPGGTP